MWARFIVAAVGIWLMAAPAVLKYGNPAQANDRIIGPVVATFAIIAIWEITRGLRWMNFLLGLWLVAAPFLMGYDNATPRWNDVAAGAVIVGLSLVKGKITQKFGGGWRSLFCSCLTRDERPIQSST